MTAKLPIIIQPNADGNIQRMQYKFKGSTINVRYYYDNSGHLNRLDIPISLNLTHWEVLELINMLYLQHLTYMTHIQLSPVSGASLNGITVVLGIGGQPFKTTKITTSLTFAPAQDKTFNCIITLTLTTGVA